MNAFTLAMAVAASLSALPAAAQTAPAVPRGSDPATLPKVYTVRIVVADLDRAERFYRQGLGAADVTIVQPHERLVHFKSGPDIMLVRVDGVKKPEHGSGFLFEVADIDAFIKRVVPAGGVVTRAPNPDSSTNNFGVRSAQISDPDGAEIEVIQFTAPKK